MITMADGVPAKSSCGRGSWHHTEWPVGVGRQPMQHQRGARGRRRYRMDQPAPELREAREAAVIAVLRKMHLEKAA